LQKISPAKFSNSLLSGYGKALWGGGYRLMDLKKNERERREKGMVNGGKKC
jgi:hypothetical protein